MKQVVFKAPDEWHRLVAHTNGFYWHQPQKLAAMCYSNLPRGYQTNQSQQIKSNQIESSQAKPSKHVWARTAARATTAKKKETVCCSPVVLRGDVALGRAHVDARLVHPSVPELHLERLQENINEDTRSKNDTTRSSHTFHTRSTEHMGRPSLASRCSFPSLRALFTSTQRTHTDKHLPDAASDTSTRTSTNASHKQASS